MQNLQTISTTKLRDNLAEVLERVAIGKQSFLVSKFGNKKALLVPVSDQKASFTKDLKSLSAYGMWKSRKDIKDSTEWVDKLRKKESNREKT